MTDLERRALLGDQKAQKECTRKGISLPCPFCGEPQEIDFCVNKVHHSRNKCIFSNKFVELEDWNTRTAPPIGRCRECANRKTQECSMYYRCTCGEQHTWESNDDFCSDFEPKEDDSDEGAQETAEERNS